MNTLRALAVVAIFAASAVTASAATINVPADAATIQGGIDLAFDGDTVVVAAGTYSGFVFLDQRNNLTIQASGVVILAPDRKVKNAPAAFALSSCQNITFDGFTISRPPGSGINVGTSLNVTIRNCIVDRAKGAGISVFGGSDVTIADCSVTKTGTKRTGIGADPGVGPPSVRLRVQRCTVAKAGGAGINARGSSVIVEDCTVTGSKRAGIELDRTVSNDFGIVRRCIVTGSGESGIVATGNVVNIDHNTVNASTEYGIAVIQDPNGGTASPVIGDNVVTKTKKKDGILVGVAGCNLDRNTVTSARGDGIRVLETGTEVRDNVVTKSGAFGLHLFGSGHDVTGNSATGSKKRDLRDESTGTTFAGNTFVKGKN